MLFAVASKKVKIFCFVAQIYAHKNVKLTQNSHYKLRDTQALSDTPRSSLNAAKPIWITKYVQHNVKWTHNHIHMCLNVFVYLCICVWLCEYRKDYSYAFGQLLIMHICMCSCSCISLHKLFKYARVTVKLFCFYSYTGQCMLTNIYTHTYACISNCLLHIQANKLKIIFQFIDTNCCLHIHMHSWLYVCVCMQLCTR